MNKNVPWPYPDNGAEDFLENVALQQMQADQSYHWAICKNENIEEGIGVLSFRHNMDNNDGHRGFWIEINEQGNGYVTEACYALNNYVFNDLKWQSFTTENATENKASSRIKEKTGGILIDEQEREFVCGKCKTEIWETTKENWENMKNKSS